MFTGTCHKNRKAIQQLNVLQTLSFSMNFLFHHLNIREEFKCIDVLKTDLIQSAGILWVVRNMDKNEMKNTYFIPEGKFIFFEESRKPLIHIFLFVDRSK